MGNLYLSPDGVGQISDLGYARKLIDHEDEYFLVRTSDHDRNTEAQIQPSPRCGIPMVVHVVAPCAILPEGAPSPLHRLKYLRTGLSGTESKEWWDLGMLRCDLVKRYQAFEKDWPDKLFDSVLKGVHQHSATQYDRLARVVGGELIGTAS
ncbi:hypothetical protein FRB95_013564 [Tulasnella sp. JGI-2019a]|nr:hypothetical protein FRB93_002177 [Tulasnella sp. JGI-2019a]KAG9038886.1 hypothetical protein FRB95_013564 [Tulasnella sp. JGI-2019a]